MKGKVKVQPVVALKVRPFALERVRLLDGPFKTAQEADHRYLLTVDPLRLLHGFYQNAGLPTRGEAYGGWEQMDIAGHSLGHYLSACSMMYAATGDARLLEKVRLTVDELKKCQDAHKDGMVAGFPQADRVWGEIKKGEIRSQPFNLNGIWVPWYNEHKLLSGLAEAYFYCDSTDALLVATKLADWAIEETKGLTHDQWQTMLGTEQGGMNEALANLYGITGEKKYLELAEKFQHEKVLGPLERGERKLAGLHGNTNIPKVIGAARDYELSGEKRFSEIASNFWHEVVEDHTYVSGGNTLAEYFGPPRQLSARIGSNTTETCNTYNMLKLTQHIFCWQPSVALGDYYERALWNHILASVNPEQYGVTYFLPLGMGVQKHFSSAFDDFTCCHGTGMENHAKYGEAVYYEDGDTLYVDQFISSELDWKEKGVKVRWDCSPDGTEGVLSFDCEEAVRFTVAVRAPVWAEELHYRLNNGMSWAGAPSGEFFTMANTWRKGLTLEIALPSQVRTEGMPDDARRVAFFYGPMLLAGLWGAADDGRGLPPTVVDSTDEDLAQRPIGADAWHWTSTTMRPSNIEVVPFYQVASQKYSVFFDKVTAEQWKARADAHAAEHSRLKELESRTVEFVDVGSQRAAREHNLKSESSFTGVLNDKRWRDARNGGWFEFEIAVDPDGPNQLVLTYWGGDGGNRVFDVLVDGKAIATQRLTGDRPGVFFDVVHDLPLEATKGKKGVTVRIQAAPGAMAGGVFGVRTVRAKT